MSKLIHKNKIIAEVNANWQTKVRSTNQDEYKIYLACANNGQGIDITTGKPLKTFKEWLQS